MANPESTQQAVPAIRWSRIAVIAFLAATYITLFWGEGAALLPEPFNEWGRIFRPTIEGWRDTLPIQWLTAHVAIGLIVPSIALALMGRRPTELGLAQPNQVGWWLTLFGIAVSIPFGVWLSWSLGGFAPPVVDTRYACELLAMIPEHYLISGVIVALLLPGCRLPASGTVRSTPDVLRSHRDIPQRGGVQGENQSGPAARALFALPARAEFIAMIVSGALFMLAHAGKPLLEVALSLPGGIVVAFLTLRSHSIWPVVIAHWSLNLIPTALAHLLHT